MSTLVERAGSIIRDATAADLDAMLAIYNDAVLNTTAIYDYEARSLEAQRQWLAAKGAQGWPVLVAEADGAVAGYASFGPFRAWPAYLHTIESSVYVAPDHRSRGIGTALVRGLIERAQARNAHAAVAGIDADNGPSLRLHAKLGFERVAHFRQVGWKFGRWLDLVFMQRLLA